MGLIAVSSSHVQNKLSAFAFFREQIPYVASLALATTKTILSSV